MRGEFPPDLANNAFPSLPQVHQIQAELEPAHLWLTSNYIDLEGLGVTIGWDHIQVGEDQTTLYYRGTDNDILIGTNESDLLFGESGADILQGGGGNDVLYGGTGTDLYRIGFSDGNDTIVETPDADGVARGVIVYGDDTSTSVVCRVSNGAARTVMTI